MKKLLCAALILALIVPSITGCRRKQAADSADGNAGPGYTITDGEIIGGQQQTVSQAPYETIPTAAPVAAPIDETLPPKEVAAIEAEHAEENAAEGIVVETPEPEITEKPTEEPQSDMPVMGTYDESKDRLVSSPALIDVSTYQFSALMDENVDINMNYPTDWKSVPGVYTVCFRESRDDGGFPARVSVTRKKLVHTPDEQGVIDQLVLFMKYIYKQYDPDTFQTSTANMEATFMGNDAMSNTYLAYWGDIEVKGFVIGCAIKRTLYVFHFCASYEDYLALQNIMQYMMNSVQLKDDEDKK